mmetsp:Transcript_72435/g.172647  ORF Transcript_72435/g.172647 Transcript_72435/m.172647 type:complete len:226 (-) Transcript_72435:672-1349(-)
MCTALCTTEELQGSSWESIRRTRDSNTLQNSWRMWRGYGTGAASFLLTRRFQTSSLMLPLRRKLQSSRTSGFDCWSRLSFAQQDFHPRVSRLGLSSQRRVLPRDFGSILHQELRVLNATLPAYGFNLQRRGSKHRSLPRHPDFSSTLLSRRLRHWKARSRPSGLQVPRRHQLREALSFSMRPQPISRSCSRECGRCERSPRTELQVSRKPSKSCLPLRMRRRDAS